MSLVLFSGGTHAKVNYSLYPHHSAPEIRAPFNWGHSAVWPCLHVSVESIVTCGVQRTLRNGSTVIEVHSPVCWHGGFQTAQMWMSSVPDSALRACVRRYQSLNTLLTQASSDGALIDPLPRPRPRRQPALSHPAGVVCAWSSCGCEWREADGHSLPQRYGFLIDTDTIYSCGVGEDKTSSSE